MKLQSKVSLYLLAVILFNLIKIKNKPQYQGLGVSKTLNTLLRTLNIQVSIPTEVIEESLYYCNLVHEEGFVHPANDDFDNFLEDVKKNSLSFDKKTNLLSEVPNAK